MSDTNTAAAAPAVAIPPGYMEDHKGRLVPEAQVRPQDLLQDQMVRKIVGYADDLSAQIKRFRAHTFDDVGTFLAILAERYGSARGGQKGNMTFQTFDGRLKVQVQVADRLTFGPELQIARGLVEECIAEWAEGSRAEIRTLVDHAFAVDKEGQVAREHIFALRRLEIDDERWQRAMAAIDDSIRVAGSRTYVRFYRRASPQDRWEAVPIDLAAVS